MRPHRTLQLLYWAWSIGVAIAIGCAMPWSIAHHGGDWQVFVSAGSLAGTPALLNPPEAWQAFFYLPGAAWVLVPFAHLPLAVSFPLAAAVMLACAAGAGILAARTYRLPHATAVAAYALWSPVVYAATVIGQNAPFGLLLAQLSIAGMAKRSVLLTALPIGALLYKPTYAPPLVGLLIVRGMRRELAVVTACACGWYAASVAATGGDWEWPIAWARLLSRFAAGDLSVNGPFAISLPALVLRMLAGAPAMTTAVLPGLTVTFVPSVLVVAILVAAAGVACAVALRRASAVEAGSAACLAGLALSPHAWAYDAALALPMIALTAAAVAEPVRTRVLLALAIAAPLFLLARQLHVDVLAVVVIGGTLAWLAVRLRPGATRARCRGLRPLVER